MPVRKIVTMDATARRILTGIQRAVFVPQDGCIAGAEAYTPTRGDRTDRFGEVKEGAGRADPRKSILPLSGMSWGI